MERVCERGLVATDTSDLGSERGVTRSSLGERRSEEGDDVVTAGEDEVSDNLLVSVDDEVTSKRGRLLVRGDQRRRRRALEVASI